MGDRSLGGVFDGDDPVARLPAGDLIEDVGKIRLRGICDRVAEFLDRRLMGPGALGPEVGDFHVVLEGECGGHDLAVDRLDGFLGKAALVEGNEAV